MGAEVGRGGGDCQASTAAKGLPILLILLLFLLLLLLHHLLLLLLLLVLILLLLLLHSWQLASIGGPAATLPAAPRDFSEKISASGYLVEEILGGLRRNISRGILGGRNIWRIAKYLVKRNIFGVKRGPHKCESEANMGQIGLVQTKIWSFRCLVFDEHKLCPLFLKDDSVQ